MSRDCGSVNAELQTSVIHLFRLIASSNRWEATPQGSGGPNIATPFVDDFGKISISASARFGNNKTIGYTMINIGLLPCRGIYLITKFKILPTNTNVPVLNSSLFLKQIQKRTAYYIDSKSDHWSEKILKFGSYPELRELLVTYDRLAKLKGKIELFKIR